MKREIQTFTLTALLGAATLFGSGCDYQTAEQRLEPVAQAWSDKDGSRYTTIDLAREAVYKSADLNRDGRVSTVEADSFLAAYQREN